MPFPNIIKLDNTCHVQSQYYFIDANVWIYALQGDDLLKYWQKKYTNFFYDIIDSKLEPKPKILMPSLLFSEILNTFLKQIAFSEYKLLNNPSSDFKYKPDYRNDEHYKDNYERVCDDINGYRESILFINDESLLSDPPLYLSPAVHPFDFNDFFYYQICKEFQKTNPITIVTNDCDFQTNDIPIITINRTLLTLQ